MFAARDRHGDLPAGLRKFQRVRQQVGEDLLQAVRVAAHRHRLGRHFERERDVLRSRRGERRIDRRPSDVAQIERTALQLEPSAGDARDVGQVLDQLFLRPRIPSDDFQRVPAHVVGQAVLEHVAPAHDRVQRRAQLVREDREELVLRAVGELGVAIEPGVVHGDAGPPRHFVEHGHVVVRERVVDAAADERDHAERVPAGRQRRQQHRTRSQFVQHPQVLRIARAARQHFVADVRVERGHAGAQDIVDARRRRRIHGIARLEHARQLDLLRIDVRRDDALDRVVGLLDVDRAPVGDARNREVRQVAQRLLVIERSQQRRGVRKKGHPSRVRFRQRARPLQRLVGLRVPERRRGHLAERRTHADLGVAECVPGAVINDDRRPPLASDRHRDDQQRLDALIAVRGAARIDQRAVGDIGNRQGLSERDERARQGGRGVGLAQSGRMDDAPLVACGVEHPHGMRVTRKHALCERDHAGMGCRLAARREHRIGPLGEREQPRAQVALLVGGAPRVLDVVRRADPLDDPAVLLDRDGADRRPPILAVRAPHAELEGDRHSGGGRLGGADADVLPIVRMDGAHPAELRVFRLRLTRVPFPGLIAARWAQLRVEHPDDAALGGQQCFVPSCFALDALCVDTAFGRVHHQRRPWG